jgi:hypothetical protein
MELVTEKMKPGFCLANGASECKNPVSKAETGSSASFRRVTFAALLLAAAGCTTTADLIPAIGDGPASGEVTQVSAVWHDQVLFSPDPANGGVMSPGLAGRLFFFGPNMGHPLAANGDVVVGLFDPTHLGPDGSPTALGTWKFEKAMLQQFLRHDTIGWGYTLLLPWPSYRPDIKQVEMRVRYDAGKKSLPIYAQPATICFGNIMDIQSSTASQLIRAPEHKAGVAPASHQTPTKGS